MEWTQKEYFPVPVLGVIFLKHLVVLADGRQEHDQEDVLETVDPLLPLRSLAPNINLEFVIHMIDE